MGKIKTSFLISVDQINGMKNISDKQFRDVIMAMLEIDNGGKTKDIRLKSMYIKKSKVG